MANTLKLKRSAVPGKTPLTTDLNLGELALNTYDGVLYTKKNVSGTESIVNLTGSSGGSSVLPINSVINYPAAAQDGTDFVTIGSTYWTSLGKRVPYNATYHDHANIAPIFKEFGTDVSVGTTSDLATGGSSIYWDGTKWMLLIATLSSNHLLTSTDGVTWTTRTIAAGVSFTNAKIISNGTIWVAITTTTNQFYTSTDGGVTWTSRTTNGPVCGSYFSLAWNGTRFVCGSSIGQPYYSTDGITWTAGTVNNNGTVQMVKWTGTKFFAVNVNSSVTYISWSTDGITWTQVNNSYMYGAVTHAGNNDNLLIIDYFGNIFRSTSASPVFINPIGQLKSETGGSSGMTFGDFIYSGGLSYYNGSFYLKGISGFYSSSDNGSTWTCLAAIPPCWPGIGAHPAKLYDWNGTYFLFMMSAQLNGHSTSGNVSAWGDGVSYGLSNRLYKLQTWTGVPKYVGNYMFNNFPHQLLRTK
jgi:hypothetical protein